MMKTLNVIILSLFMLSGIFIPFANAKGTAAAMESDEQALSIQIFEEEVHHDEEEVVTITPSFEFEYSFPLHINLTQQLVYSDDHKPPLF